MMRWNYLGLYWWFSLPESCCSIRVCLIKKEAKTPNLAGARVPEMGAELAVFFSDTWAGAGGDTELHPFFFPSLRPQFQILCLCTPQASKCRISEVKFTSLALSPRNACKSNTQASTVQKWIKVSEWIKLTPEVEVQWKVRVFRRFLQVQHWDDLVSGVPCFCFLNEGFRPLH